MTSNDELPAADGGLVYVRFGHDPRLHCVADESDVASARPDIVLVEDHDGAVQAARIVGECHRSSDSARTYGRIVAGYNIDSEGSELLADIVEVGGIPEDRTSGHRWGALGLPFGTDSRLSPVNHTLNSDDVYAISSRGYMESAGERIHQLAPGDIVVVRGRNAMVTAIDRRNNTIELSDSNDRSIVEMSLDTFIEEEQQ